MPRFRESSGTPSIPAATTGPSIIAAIDIGTNSVHLVVAQVDHAGHLKILDADKVSVRLGEAITANGAISADGIRRTVKAVEHMVELAGGYDCTIRAIATHATREATNHHDLIEEVYRKTKVRIEVIDGVEEARLIYLGMRHGMHIDHQVCLGLDIGGGSTEVIIARGEDVRFVTSMRLGAVTLSATHFGGKAPAAKSLARLHEEIDLKLGPLLKDAHNLRFTKAIASSGTAKTLISLGANDTKTRGMGDGNGMRLKRRQLDRLCREMEELKSPRKITEKLDVDPSRADIIVAGAAIMGAVSRAFRVEEWTYSSYGLREGIVVDTWQRMRGDARRHAPQVRLQSVYELGRRAGIDEKQARAVSELSSQIFNQLIPRIYSNLSRSEFVFMRDMLHAASWLHEVGRFVNVSGYHRHSQYLIEHTRLMGFTQDERVFVSLLVRHHRKSPPPPKPPENTEINRDEWGWLQVLAGILRLTTALHRSRRNRVKAVKLRMLNGAIKLSLGVGSGNGIDVELQKAHLELPLVEAAWEWPLRLECVGVRAARPRTIARKRFRRFRRVRKKSR